MATQVKCPACTNAVRVPEELVGNRVQCPLCHETFVARIDELAPAETPPPLPPPLPGETKTEDANPEFVPEQNDRPRRRRWIQPHRASTVLVLGILSLVVCTPLGIAAWVMGNNDMAAIRRGEMDPEGEGMTQAGRICGIVGTCFFILQCVIFSLYAFLVVGVLAAHN
jgi:hypothetical protein